jgi:ArsR family transcriptional regulator
MIVYMSGMSPVEDLIEKLKAAGEPTRLRLLALLRDHDLSVGELVQVLGQSQPRLSHHLKNLSEAGLAERLPEGAFVFYRAARSGAGLAFLDQLFRQVSPEAPEFQEDRDKLRDVMLARAASAETYFSSIAENWDSLRALHFPNEAIEDTLLELAGSGPHRRVVDFGTGTGRMLLLFSGLAVEAEGIDFSHRMLTVARANLERAGVSNSRVRFGDVSAAPFEDASADLVIVHQVLHYLDAPGDAIAEAARILMPGGKLLVIDFAPHDLEFLRAEHGHRRLGVRHDALSEWAHAAGLKLEAPRSFDPPAPDAPGLTVNIWQAIKPSIVKARAA